jgi:hypothetical protein
MVYYVYMQSSIPTGSVTPRQTPIGGDTSEAPTVVELCEFILRPNVFPGGYTLFAITVCHDVVCSDCIANNWLELLQDLDPAIEWAKTTLRVARIHSMADIVGTLDCDRCSNQIE